MRDMILHGFHALVWAVVLTALLTSAWTDLKGRIIPNQLVGMVAISGLLISLVARPELIWISLIATLALLIGLGFLAHFDLIGGGDVKLIGAAALLFPPDRIGHLLISIVLAGGLLSIGYLAARYAVRRHSAQPQTSNMETGSDVRPSAAWFSDERARIAAGGPMPYALAIAGGVIVLKAGELLKCLPASFCSF